MCKPLTLALCIGADFNVADMKVLSLSSIATAYCDKHLIYVELVNGSKFVARRSDNVGDKPFTNNGDAFDTWRGHRADCA